MNRCETCIVADQCSNTCRIFGTLIAADASHMLFMSPGFPGVSWVSAVMVVRAQHRTPHDTPRVHKETVPDRQQLMGSSEFPAGNPGLWNHMNAAPGQEPCNAYWWLCGTRVPIIELGSKSRTRPH
mgnify:CR=1 FL=1